MLGHCPPPSQVSRPSSAEALKGPSSYVRVGALGAGSLMYFMPPSLAPYHSGNWNLLLWHLRIGPKNTI